MWSLPGSWQNLPCYIQLPKFVQAYVYSACPFLGVASCEWSSVADAYLDLNHLAGLDVGTLECSVYCIRGSAGACLS